MFVGFIIALAMYYSLLAIWYLSRKGDTPVPPEKKAKYPLWKAKLWVKAAM